VIWYLGPSAIVIGVAVFVVIVFMSVFGAGAVAVWVRRHLSPRNRGSGDR
jgi:hypothetical protein